MLSGTRESIHRARDVDVWNKVEAGYFHSVVVGMERKHCEDDGCFGRASGLHLGIVALHDLSF